MSGGFFDYNQYRICSIIDSIERELNRQGEAKPNDELYGGLKYYEDHPDERYYIVYPQIVQDKMIEAIKYLRIASIYTQRIDWYLSGDDGEENFLESLSEELKEIEI